MGEFDVFSLFTMMFSPEFQKGGAFKLNSLQPVDVEISWQQQGKNYVVEITDETSEEITLTFKIKGNQLKLAIYIDDSMIPVSEPGEDTSSVTMTF